MVVNQIENAHPEEGDLFFQEANINNDFILENVPNSTVFWHHATQQTLKQLENDHQKTALK